MFLDDKPAEELTKLGEMILDRMEELQKTEKKVLLKADLEAAYGRVVDVMNAIRDAQIEVIGLVTEQENNILGIVYSLRDTKREEAILPFFFT